MLKYGWTVDFLQVWIPGRHTSLSLVPALHLLKTDVFDRCNTGSLILDATRILCGGASQLASEIFLHQNFNHNKAWNIKTWQKLPKQICFLPKKKPFLTSKKLSMRIFICVQTREKKTLVISSQSIIKNDKKNRFSYTYFDFNLHRK